MIEKIINRALLFLVFFLSCCLYFKDRELNSLKLELSNAQIEAQTKTAELNRKLLDLQERETEELKKHEITVNDLRKRTANGVHIANKSMPDSTRAKTCKNATYIDARTAGALISITERGNKAIINLNKCIEQYNALQQILNKK